MSKEENKNEDTKSKKSHHSKKSHSMSHSKNPEKEEKTNNDVANPSIEQPSIVNVNVMQEKICATHSQSLKYYCDTCEEPICYECTVQGPHNSQMHRAITLSEAFGNRYSSIQNTIANPIAKKREKICMQMQKLTIRIEEIKKVKEIIERDIRCEYSGMLERLRSSEGIKLAMLNHEMCDLQQDMDKIEAIVMHMSAVSREKDVIGFLTIFVKLYEDIENILAKPLRTEIAINPMDLPRELTEKRKLCADALNIENALKFKNDIIWKMINDTKQEEAISFKALEEETKKEFDKWALLTDKFANELSKFENVICRFCGVAMNGKTLNEDCSYNNVNEPPSVLEGVPKEFYGKKRHYFAKQA